MEKASLLKMVFVFQAGMIQNKHLSVRKKPVILNLNAIFIRTNHSTLPSTQTGTLVAEYLTCFGPQQHWKYVAETFYLK